MGLTLLVYSSLLLGVMVLGLPYWAARMLFSGRYRAGLAERLGRVPQGLRETCAGRNVVWLHAVSVGEVLAATRLVEELRGALPGWLIAVSTTTETGQRLARERFVGSPVFYLPLDFAVLMRRYLGVLRPRLVVLMESELWPNMIHTCHAEGVPLAVVNARVSDRSFPRYMRLKRLWGPLLREVTVFLAQSEETAGRLRSMGVAAERVKVAGNLKYDVRVGEPSAMTRRVASLLFQTRLMVAGSTLPGEEEMLLAAWPEVHKAHPDVAMLIAPRHKDRFDEVLAAIRKSRFPFFRCSHLLLDTEPIFGGTILLLDTIGDLASMYSAATLAFVGGSLVAKGGHNPLEAAQFRVPVMMGKSYENFREIVERMRAANAIRIVDRMNFAGNTIELLRDAGDMGERGRRVFEQQQGATARVVAELMELVQ